MARLRITVAVLAAFAFTGAASAKEADLKEYVKSHQSKTAYGAYMKGRKVGWRTIESKLGKFEGQDVRIKTEQMLMLMQSRGAVYRTESTDKTIHSLTGNGELLYYESVAKSNGRETRIVARAKGRTLVITTTGDGKTRSRTVPMSKDTIRQDMQLEAWLRATRRPGDHLEGMTFTASGSALDQKMSATFVKTSRMNVKGAATDVVHYTISSDGVKAEIISTKAGDAVLVNGGVIVFKLESETQAKTLAVASIDSAFNIPVKKQLGDPRGINRMTLEITGLKRGDFPTSHRQRIVSEKDGVLTVELSRDFRDDAVRHPLTAADRKKYLEATDRIQTDDATIQKLARKIVGSEKDPLKQAALLQEWVYQNLKKTYAITADTSLGVLQNKAGKCTDHALLFTALARAIGLPAREVVGVMYEPIPNAPDFGWHAWVDVYDGKRWVSLDPTLGEMLIDATHIRFSTGNNAPVMARKIAITIKRSESSNTILGAMGWAGISNAAASRLNLQLLYRSLERNLLTGKEVGEEAKRIIKRIDRTIRLLERVAKSDVSNIDRRGVKQLLAIYRSLKVQAETLKSLSERRDKANLAKLQQVEAQVKKQLSAFGV